MKIKMMNLNDPGYYIPTDNKKNEIASNFQLMIVKNVMVLKQIILV